MALRASDRRMPAALRECKRANWLKRKPGFGDERCAAPVRDQASGVGNGINAATRPRVWIPGKDEAVFFRQIGVVVAQIEVEGLVGEGYTRLPIEIGRQREAAELRNLVTEPGIAGSSRERHAEVLRQETSWHVVAQPGRHILTPGARVRDIRRIGVAGGGADRLADASVAADRRLPI